MFSTLWKSFTFTSNIASEGLFHWKVVGFFFFFVKCLLRKKKTILTFQPSSRFFCENLSERQGYLAPTPRNSSSQVAHGEGRQRADAGNKAERKGKTRKKRGGSENWRPGAVHSQLSLSAQWEAGSGGHGTTSGSTPGHWLSEGRPEAKDIPAVTPAQHLPSIPHLWRWQPSSSSLVRIRRMKCRHKMKGKGGQKNKREHARFTKWYL